MAAASPLPLMAQTVPASAPSTTAPADEEPILPDDEFNARLPGAGSVDDKASNSATDSKAPLPSIDDWLDQQMPAQGSAQGSAPASGTTPATGAELPPRHRTAGRNRTGPAAARARQRDRAGKCRR